MNFTADRKKYIAEEPSHDIEYLIGYYQVAVMYLYVRPLLERISVS